MIRSPIYKAITQQLTVGLVNVPPYGVQSVSRGFVHWENCDNQPAIYVVPVKENNTYKAGTPNRWLLHCELWVYVRWVDSVQQGSDALATIMDGIELVLSPTGPNGSRGGTQGAVNTLGGLVTYCALQGPGDISNGFLNGSQSIARMPLEILVPG